MKVLRTHKTRIYPTDEQTILIEKSFNVARYSWNIALSEWNLRYIEHVTSGGRTDRPIAYDIRNDFIRLVRPMKPWISEVSKDVYAESILELGKAWNRYFKHQSKGRPKFKSKKKSKDSFTMKTVKKGFMSWKQNRLLVPKFRKDNYLTTAEFPRWNGELKSVTISKKAGKYYASCLFELDMAPVQYKRHKKKTNKVGIDLGIKTLAIMSDGTISAKVDTKKIDSRIKKCQRNLARKQYGSKNRLKAITKLQRAYDTKANMLKDHLHKTTNYIVRKYNYICLEDLSSSNMVRNHKLARSVSDAQFYEFKRQVEYKIKYLIERGVSVGLTYADRFYPSSKTCSFCGFKKDKLSLSERIYHCDNCHESIDRDLNAAINLERLITSYN